MGIAVVGCGQWGMNHVRAWASLGALAAVVDPDASRREHAAAAAGVPAFTQLQKALEVDEVTGVVVATPAATHADIAAVALHAGRHVLVEKPLALTVPEAEKLLVQAEEAERVLMVGHVLEYHPAVLALRDLVARGDLGKLRYLYSNRLNFGRLRTEENALWSFAPHDVALILRLTGSTPAEVTCRGSSFVSQDVEDVTLMSMSFPTGIDAHIFVSWLHPFKEQRFVVVGEGAMAVFDDTAPWAEKLLVYPHRIDWLEGRVPVARKAEAVAVALVETEPLEQECRDFLRAIDGGTPLADGASGVRVLEVLDAARRSLASGGAPVAPAEVPVQDVALVHPTAVVDEGASIGRGTRVWHFCHVMPGAVIGDGCVLGQNVFVAAGARIGDRVRIQNNVSVYEGVELGDGVFCGPSAVFTNVKHARADVSRRDELLATRVGRGATIGANATVVCGTSIGDYAFVAAGAVVTADVAPFAIVAGVPARRIGWACRCGETLPTGGGEVSCQRCGSVHHDDGLALRPLAPAHPVEGGTCDIC